MDVFSRKIVSSTEDGRPGIVNKDVDGNYVQVFYQACLQAAVMS